MGSFNLVCSVSQQSIATDDACRVLPIIQQTDYTAVSVQKDNVSREVFGVSHSTCHYDSFWSPLGSSLAGVYADYGKVTLDDDGTNQQSLLAFFQYLKEYSWISLQGDNSVHDVPVNLQEFLTKKTPALAKVLDGELCYDAGAGIDAEIEACFAYIWHAVEEQRLFVSNYRGEPRAVNFATIHGRAYDYLVAKHSTGLDWHKNSKDPYEILRKVIAPIMAKAGDLSDIRERTRMEFCLADKLRDTFSMADDVNRTVGLATYKVLESLTYTFLVGDFTEEEFVDNLVPHYNDRLFLRGMDYLNLRLTPMTTGGQDSRNEAGRDYAAFVSTLSQDIYRDRLQVMYGPFQGYTLSVGSQEMLDRLVSVISDCDAAVENVKILEISKDGILTVNLDVTHDLETMQEIVEDQFDSTETTLIRATLRSRKIENQ